MHATYYAFRVSFNYPAALISQNSLLDRNRYRLVVNDVIHDYARACAKKMSTGQGFGRGGRGAALRQVRG